MNTDIQNEQIEIIQEFVLETRDMVEQLEPTIIELGQDIKTVNCWEVKGCEKKDCPRYEKTFDLPCWLHVGYIDTGKGICNMAESKLDCLNCDVFQQTNGDNQTINAIFRLFHSMKGSAGFLELEHITKVAHSAENLLDLIRNGGIVLNDQHISLLCQSCDFTKDALEYLEENFADHGMAEGADDITGKLQQSISDSNEFIENARKAVSGEADEPKSAIELAKEVITKEGDTLTEDLPISDEEFSFSPEMQERFVQEADELLVAFEQNLLKWMDDGNNDEIISELFRNIHSFKGDCGFFGYADLEKLTHQIETVLDVSKAGANMDKHKAAKVLLELVDVVRLAIINVSEGGEGTIANVNIYIDLLESCLPKGWTAETKENVEVPPLGDILVDQGVITQDEVEAALNEQRKPFGEILVDKGVATPHQIEKALQKQKAIRPKAPKPKTKTEMNALAQPVVKRQDIRVDLTKLDNLINIIGELVIAENVVVNNDDLNGLHLENFNKASQQMNKLIRELQEMAMVIRMIPVAGLFRRMMRLVHDLSMKAGKRVELKLVGEETELDKTVIETITDPLVHIIRNSLDHGLEPPEERKEAGKKEIGTVKLTAMHEEGEVWIIIEDDGRGLDKEKIIAKAISKGLIDGDGSEVKEKDLYSLIFQPGFSTADKVTDVSGRGVGMDVVYQNLSKTNGKVEVHSKSGVGTKILLRIPLTLAIIEGMVLRVADTKCILPILSIKESFRPTNGSVTVTPDGQEIVRIRERLFPILRLHEVLKKEPDYNDFHDGILILMEAHEKKICMFVDEIVGQQQTVIKGLSNYIGNIKGVSGCTILGNGEVSLILDAGTLIDIAES